MCVVGVAFIFALLFISGIFVMNVNNGRGLNYYTLPAVPAKRTDERDLFNSLLTSLFSEFSFRPRATNTNLNLSCSFLTAFRSLVQMSLRLSSAESPRGLLG